MKKYALGMLSLLMTMVFALQFCSLEALTEAEIQKNVTDSQPAVKAWVALIDQGKYGESWDAASLNFQLAIKRGEWIIAMQKTRATLGQVKSRDVLDIRWAVDPQGLPRGNYMVYIYKTSFTNKDNAYELLTLIQQADGSWKILTYQVS